MKCERCGEAEAVYRLSPPGEWLCRECFRGGKTTQKRLSSVDEGGLVTRVQMVPGELPIGRHGVSRADSVHSSGRSSSQRQVRPRFLVLLVLLSVCGLILGISMKHLSPKSAISLCHLYLILHIGVAIILYLSVRSKVLFNVSFFLVLLYVGTATFRNSFNILYGYAPWAMIPALLFMSSICLELNFSLRELRQSVAYQLVAMFLFLVFPTLPFSSLSVAVKPEEIRICEINRLYDPDIVLKGGKETDRKFAHDYFLDGKEEAGKRTLQGFTRSIELYREALKLVPNSSTVYAEMAYSYASIADILTEGQGSPDQIKQSFMRAAEATDSAKSYSRADPTVWANEAISDYYMGHKEDALKNLKKAKGVAEVVGFSDKVLLAEALLEKNAIVRARLLKTIVEKFEPNNAEIHNLLGISYFLINDREHAREMFERATRLSPTYGTPYLNLGLVEPKGYYELCKKASVDANLKPIIVRYEMMAKVRGWFDAIWSKAVLLSWVFIMICLLVRSPKIISLMSVFFYLVCLMLLSYVVFEVVMCSRHQVNTITHMFLFR
jgi:hypothetical protein